VRGQSVPGRAIGGDIAQEAADERARHGQRDARARETPSP
jgi:hypothetical protein